MNMNKIPTSCRDFKVDDTNVRRDFAITFVQEFVRDVAPPKGMDTCTEWTKRVAKRFSNLCPADCEAAPSASSSEYLVDFTWMEKRDGKRVLIACESEWGSDRFGMHTLWGLVEEDFEKLLSIKAPFKVLIFSSDRMQTDADSDVDFSFEHARIRLRKSLENYWHHLFGETYIFIDFPATHVQNGNGEYEAFCWIAKDVGKSMVEFEHLTHGELNRPDGN
jgi:hypothetical protein